MAQRLWFAAKRYGYGWYPVTWEGWVVVIGFVVLALAPSLVVLWLDIDVSDAAYAALFIPYVCVLTLVLIWISARKGEKARWRWGK